jgi:outer membrane protein assembly factor BamB
VNSSAGLAGHDANTGQPLWRFDEANRFPVPMPLAHDGIIYTSRGYRSSPFMALRPGGRGDIAASHVVWRVASGAPYISSLVYYDGLIYMMGDVGVLTVTDAKSGERVFQERIGGVYSASPVAADGKVYLLSEDGETVVIAAGRTPRVLARNRLNARQLASPAIAGSRIFIRSDAELFAIGR